MNEEQLPSETPSTEGNPFNQAGLSTLIIGVGSLAIEDPKNQWYKTAIALLAPFISYFLVWGWATGKREYKRNKYCSAIKNQIKLLRKENESEGVLAEEKSENQQEIMRLKKLLSDTTIKKYEIN